MTNVITAIRRPLITILVLAARAMTNVITAIWRSLIAILTLAAWLSAIIAFVASMFIFPWWIVCVGSAVVALCYGGMCNRR
jgi:hypothetical protein